MVKESCVRTSSGRPNASTTPTKRQRVYGIDLIDKVTRPPCRRCGTREHRTHQAEPAKRYSGNAWSKEGYAGIAGLAAVRFCRGRDADARLWANAVDFGLLNALSLGPLNLLRRWTKS